MCVCVCVCVCATADIEVETLDEDERALMNEVVAMTGKLTLTVAISAQNNH